MTAAEARVVFLALVHNHPDASDDPRRFASLLADRFEGRWRREAAVLGAAVQEGVPDALRAGRGPFSALAAPLGDRLVVNYTTNVPHGLVGVMTSVSSPIGSTRYPMLTVAIETATHGIARPNYWPSLLGHEFGHLYAIMKLGHPDAYHGNAEIFIDSTQPRYGTGITITFEERFRNEYLNAKGLAR